MPRSRVWTTIGSIYVLIPLIVVAATALAYYSYGSAAELAQQGEKSVKETTAQLAAIQIARVEKVILDANEALFNSIDLEKMGEVPLVLKKIMESSRVVEAALILDDKLEIVPGTNHGKRQPTDEGGGFREVFERNLKNSLNLRSLAIDERRHVHQEVEGRYVLISFMRRWVNGKNYYIVVEDDLADIVSEEFPVFFSGMENTHLYQIVDQYGNVVFGHPQIPRRYAVELTFPNTLSAWTLRMGPRDTQSLIVKQQKSKGYRGLLIILSAATIFVGLGILTVAVRTERHANRLKSDFIANVSHELKTPLSLIRMFGELLATGRTKGPETAREYAEIITRESERLSRLIDNVLDFARIERGKAAFSFQIGDLAEVLSRGLDVYRYRLDREQMKLTVDIAEDLPPVRIDENAMTLVLLNLVDNAVKYAAEGKALHVALSHSLSHGQDRVLLQVQDQGQGIGPDEQERVFDRFYRARTVRNQPVRGSGIGLSLVKHIVEAHGGGVSVESEIGKGSTFTVWLPVASPDTMSNDSLDGAVAT